MNAVTQLRLPDEEMEQLVRRAQKGDAQALEQLVEASYRLVRKVAAPLLPSSAVDDAVQETYLIVLQKLHHLQHPGAFRSWISRIALHVCYGWRRKSKPTEELSPEQAVTDLSATDKSLTLKAALESLPQNDRDILILREYLGLTYEEIADTLLLAEGTVRSRLFNARKKLRDALQKGTP